MFGRQKIAMIVGEFLGTAVLASAVLAMVGRTDFPFFVAIAAGLTMGLMTLVLGSTSGAHINPAVTIGLWTLRKIQTTQAVVYIAAQMLGGLTAWKLSEYLLNTQLRNMADKAFDWRIFVAEVVGTFVFGFGIAAAVSRNYENSMRATVIGGSLLMGILVASFGSNGLLNPAVALGVHSWSWTYATAPIVGSVVGMNLYMMLFTDVMPRRVKAAPVTVKKTASRAKKKR